MISFTLATWAIIPLGDTFNCCVWVPDVSDFLLDVCSQCQLDSLCSACPKQSRSAPFPMSTLPFLHSLFWLVSPFFHLLTLPDCGHLRCSPLLSPVFSNKLLGPAVFTSHSLHSKKDLKWNVSQFLHLSPAVPSHCCHLVWVLIGCGLLLGHPAFNFSLFPSGLWAFYSKDAL